jgi:hypothetical protein
MEWHQTGAIKKFYSKKPESPLKIGDWKNDIDLLNLTQYTDLFLNYSPKIGI